jgi:hypothetical protein
MRSSDRSPLPGSTPTWTPARRRYTGSRRHRPPGDSTHGYQDGHAGYSDPFDEQQFIVNEINALERTPDWSSTAVVISYDDSDGWYDHGFSGIQKPCSSTQPPASRSNQRVQPC